MKGELGFENLIRTASTLEVVLKQISVNAWVTQDGDDSFHRNVRLDGEIRTWGHSNAPEKNGLSFKLSGPDDRAIITIQPVKGGRVEFDISRGIVTMALFTTYNAAGEVVSFVMIAGFTAK
jgi:hypothetical protein